MDNRDGDSYLKRPEDEKKRIGNCSRHRNFLLVDESLLLVDDTPSLLDGAVLCFAVEV